MSASLLFLISALLGSAPSLEACDDQASECKETCSIEYGTDQSARTQLGECLMACKRQLKQCRIEVASIMSTLDGGDTDQKMGPAPR